MSSNVSSAMTSRTKPPKPVADSDTRDAIVQAALNLFAKHGVDGVSLRQIVGAAGQANPSAVHYHFQSKEGLVAAVLQHVQKQLLPLQQQAIDSMDEAQRLGTLDVREVMRLWVTPMVLMYSSSDQGRRGIRFMSRLTWQPQNMGQDQLIGCSVEHMNRVCEHLAHLIPGKTKERLFFLTVVTTANLLHSMSDASLLGRQTVLGLSEMFRDRPFELIDWMIDYMAAGLVGLDAVAGPRTANAGQHAEQA